MSFPENKLHNFNNTTIRHLLVAFKYTEDAEKVDIIPSLGEPGDVFIGEGCKGPAVVVVNEFSESDFSVFSASWDWNFYGPLSQTSSSCVGQIEITDRTGLHFVDFMRNKVQEQLGISQGHIVFALRTFFIGKSLNSEFNDVIIGNPFIFNVVSFVNNLSKGSGRFYTLGIVAASNTFGHMNQFSKIYQMDITHADGNIHKEIPIGNSSSGIKTRKQEDQLQRRNRKSRIDKSKPMKNLKEIFEAFEVELNQQKFTNSSQLQKWLQQVNNDYSDKINSPIQNKLGGLPIDFIVNLDTAYNEYPIDNRNLPFEQPDQNQLQAGLRSFSIKNGEDIAIVVKRLMKLSRKVGQDAQLDNPFIYKTTISTIKSITDRYIINVLISKIEVPKNRINENNGPGKAINSLEFIFQDPFRLDNDIIDLDTKMVCTTDLKVLETKTEKQDNLVVFGDREQITNQRFPSENFYKTQYSGLRAIACPMNYGLENAIDASKIDNLIAVDLKQTTSYRLKIQGNPNLLFDLNRLPSDVANRNIGNPTYYPFPEHEPMYAKLIIFLKPHAAIGVQENENVSTKFYFDGFLHIGSVRNIFSGGSFFQELLLFRSDDSL